MSRQVRRSGLLHLPYRQPSRTNFNHVDAIRLFLRETARSTKKVSLHFQRRTLGPVDDLYIPRSSRVVTFQSHLSYAMGLPVEEATLD